MMLWLSLTLDVLLKKDICACCQKGVIPDVGSVSHFCLETTPSRRPKWSCPPGSGQQLLLFADCQISDVQDQSGPELQLEACEAD